MYYTLDYKLIDFHAVRRFNVTGNKMNPSQSITKTLKGHQNMTDAHWWVHHRSPQATAHQFP